MKALVTYLSQTGNTKKVAESIFSGINCEKEIIPMKDVTSLDGFDIIFVGFPVWNFGPAEPAKKFLAEFCAGKKTALFVTHAMPSLSKDEHVRKQLDDILQKCKNAGEGTISSGFFNCRGELSQVISDFLLKSSNEDMKKFGTMRNETIGYPDDKEIRSAVKFAEVVINLL